MPITLPSTSSPSCCRRQPPSIPPSPAKENIMRSWIARRTLRAFASRYGYDVSYLEMLLNESSAAFFKFAPLMKASAHREVVPAEASFAAKLVGGLAEDC